MLLIALLLWSAVGRPLRAADAAPSNDIVIISATWGSTGHTADVKARVEELIKPPGNQVTVNPNTLKSRPGPDVLRHLVIVYTYAGKPATFTVDGAHPLSRQLLVDNALGHGAAAAGTAAVGPAPTSQTLTEAQLAGVVLIEGDKGVATGFFAKVRGVLCVVTNLHVLGDNEKVTVKDMEGKVVAVQNIVGAVGADIALLRVLNPSKVPDPLDTADDVLKTAKIGDPVLVVGNSLGGGVATQTVGQIKGIGPNRVELDAQFQHGNSGSPIFDLSTKQVIGVAAYAQTRTVQVIGNRGGNRGRRGGGGGGVQSETRWFGYRLDTVSQWENIDWIQWRAQSQKVSDFRETSEAVLAVLEGKFEDAKKASPRLQSIIAPCDAALARTEKAKAAVEPPAQADLDQIRTMLGAVNAFADAGTKEFSDGEYYDFFRHGEYFETSVPQQVSFRTELIKALKDLENEVATTEGKK
jgi:serine protease Do